VSSAGEDRFVGATVAGKYRIRRVIGTGSMGVVCEAENIALGKRVAIKVIDAALAGMNDIADRFRQEARAASIVESHHIVQVFDVGTDERLGLYLVMEYLAGEDLENVLRRDRRLDTDLAVKIAIQAARGLAKAHAAGVVHRDMKPSNIFLCKRDDDVEPLVKVLDFGISKVVEATRGEPKLKLTRAGTVVGTPQYMSPEQAQGFSVDQRTDVWSLGLVVYEMLAGRPAYPELPTYEQFIIHLVSHPPVPLRTVAPWVPEALSLAVHGALEHDLEKRIPTCIELAKRLLAAHPLKVLAATGSGPIEEPDTWDDPDKMAPTQAERAAAVADEPIPATEAEGSQTLVMSSPPPGMPPRSERPPKRRSAAQPAGPTTPRLLQSGVRTPRSADEPLPEDEDDAPQFFRREELERIATMAREMATPVLSPDIDVVVEDVQPSQVGRAPSAQEVADGYTARPSRARARIAWALVALAVGLGVVIAALSLR
jgi:serine/threonine protein kinase